MVGTSGKEAVFMRIPESPGETQDTGTDVSVSVRKRKISQVAEEQDTNILTQNSQSFELLFTQVLSEDPTHRNVLNDVEKIVVKKNDNIKRKLNYIMAKLDCFKEDHQETKTRNHADFILIAKGDSIQKLLSITEILKQHLKEYSPNLKSKNPSTDRRVKVIDSTKDPEAEKKKLLIEEYIQYNYLDYAVEKLSDVQKRKTKKESTEAKLTTQTIMKMKLNELDILNPKEVKVPILSIYFCANRRLTKGTNTNGEMADKISYLEQSSWTCQNQD